MNGPPFDAVGAGFYPAIMPKKRAAKAKKKPAKKDQSQIALSVVEKAIGGKLATPSKGSGVRRRGG